MNNMGRNPFINQAISQHVNQLINALNNLLIEHDGIEKKSN